MKLAITLAITSSIAWYMIAPRVVDTKIALEEPPHLVLGSVATTSDALDCYGDEEGVKAAAEARQHTDIEAGSVHVDEMYRSQGITLDAHQRFRVVLEAPPYLKLRPIGGAFDNFPCWVVARDATEYSSR